MKKVVKALILIGVITFTASIMANPVWVPPKINGKKGDIVLSPGAPGGMISDLLAILGVYYSHCGMLVDDGLKIRHNTMYIDEITQIKNGCGIPYKLKAEELSNGLPGILTESVHMAFHNPNKDHRGFKLAGGAIVAPKEEYEDAYRPNLHLAADKMKYMKGYYRVNAYMDMYQMKYQNYLQKGVGNHCSGTVWYANYYAGQTMNVATISPELVEDCAYNLYDSVKKSVEEEVGCGKIFAPNTAKNIANQVVNAFGFDRADDTSDYWRKHASSVPPAHANAPDHLLLSSFTNKLGKNPGQQSEATSWYGRVYPIKYTDGYWIGDPPTKKKKKKKGCG